MEKYILVDNGNKVATIEDKETIIDKLEVFKENNVDYSLYNFSKSIIEVLEIEKVKFALEVEDTLYFSTYSDYYDYCYLYF